MLRLRQLLDVLNNTKAKARETVKGELTQVLNSFDYRAIRSRKTEHDDYTIEALFPDGDWGDIDNLTMGLASQLVELSRFTGDVYEITVKAVEAKLECAMKSKSSVEKQLKDSGIEVADGKIRSADVAAAMKLLVTAGPVYDAFDKAFKAAANDMKEWRQIDPKAYGRNLSKFSGSEVFSGLKTTDDEGFGKAKAFLSGFIEGLRELL